MPEQTDRRTFLRQSAALAAGAATAVLMPRVGAAADSTEPLFKISLAEWSLHRALQKHELTNLDFPVVAKRDYGISA
jgi:hypothetical protein